MKIHKLKIKNEYWAEVYEGAKMFELRKNDRDFQVGDIIQFELVDADIDISEFKYMITYILKDVPEYGLQNGYCILGIAHVYEVLTDEDNIKKEVNIGKLEVNQTIIDEDKCVGDVRPADIPYDEYMKIVRENGGFKETIVKLVKKLNECRFFD